MTYRLMLLVALAACSPREPRAPRWSADDALARDVDALVARSKMSGTILIGRGETLRYFRSSDAAKFSPGDRWRWASITKQMTAILVMQEVARGRIDLAAPIARYLPAFASPNAATLTVEQLLRHQSGLPNPDTGSASVPPLYRLDSGMDAFAFCAGPVTGPPGGDWSYNNCDYVVAGALLEAVTGQTWSTLFAERIARPTGTHATLSAESDVIGYADGAREPAYAYLKYGAAGALVGTITDLWAIDRALLDGRLLDDKARATLWNGRPELGFMALGQWVYEVPLPGCASPVRLVERRGAIGGIGVRNFFAPDLGLVVIAMTNRADLEFGELWSGSGFAFELLSLAAECTHRIAPVRLRSD